MRTSVPVFGIILRYQNGAHNDYTCDNAAPVSRTLLVIERGSPRALFVVCSALDILISFSGVDFYMFSSEQVIFARLSTQLY